MMVTQQCVCRPLEDTAACMGAEVLTSLWYHSKVSCLANTLLSAIEKAFPAD